MRLTALASISLAAVLTTACGTAEKRPAATVAAGPHELRIHASDFMFQAPDSTPAGMTTIILDNGGPALHHAQLVKLDAGKTKADLAEALKKPGPFPSWAAFVPGPNAPSPNTSSNITINLEAGNYVILCLVDSPGGVPHFAKGMISGLTVTANSNAVAAASAADVSILLSDYSFTLSKPLTAGTHVIEVTSKGPQPHEVEIVRFHPGKTMDDLAKWAAKPEGPPPVDAIGGTSVQLPGAAPRFSVDLTAGDYAMLCFVPDAKDGKPHVAHGMVQTFKIG